jgi:hypothetical protein
MKAQLLTAALTLFAATASAEDFMGRLVLPKGVSPEKIELWQHVEPVSELENASLGELLAARPDAEGLFTVRPTTDSLTLSLEFSGPGIRRARFAFPSDPQTRTVFKLDAGGSALISFQDAATGAPIQGARVGPVFPGEETIAQELDRAYPFFQSAATDAGTLTLDGLMLDVPYRVPIFAPGYERTIATLRAGETTTISLHQGGAGIEGRLIGSRSQTGWPNERLQFISDGGEFSYLLRTDARGAFDITGLPPGLYRIFPLLERYGDMKPTELVVAPKQMLRRAVVEVAEGIRIDGYVVDAESGGPVLDATVTLRNLPQAVGTSGSFSFDRVMGPWPAEIRVDAPGFEFLIEDQNNDQFPPNGYEGVNIVDLPLKVRRLRWLETTLTAPAPAEGETMAPAMLELFGPLPSAEVIPPVERFRLTKPGIEEFRLKGAGLRHGVARRPDGLVSDLLTIRTAAAQTTTTLAVELGAGATLEGSFTYEGEGPAPAFRLVLTSEIDGEKVGWLTLRPEPDGSFRSEALPPGNVTARFLRSDDTAYFEEQITLARGETTTITKVFPRGIPFKGRVINPDATPQAQIPLRIYGQDQTGQPLQRLVMSGPDGEFDVQDFSGAALQEIQIDHHEWNPMVLRNVPLPQEEYEIILEPRSGLRVKLQAGESALQMARAIVLQGSIRSDELVSGQWYYSPGQQEVFAGKDTLLLTPRVSGNIQIAVEADGQWDVSPPLEWVVGAETRELAMRPAMDATLDVTVAGLQAEQFRTLLVTLINTSLPEGAPTSFTPQMNPPSSIRYSGLPAGNYLLVASTGSGDTQSKTNLYIASSEQKRIDLNFQQSFFAIDGVLYSNAKTRKALPGGTVTLHFGDIAEPPVLDSATSNSQGIFRFPLAPGGRPLLLIAEFGGQKAMSPVKPLAADEVVELAFPAPVTVQFTVPPELQSRFIANPLIPIVLTPADGALSGQTFPAADATKPVTIFPGTFTVFWGEELLGPLVVPESGGTIPLPTGGGV